ncbi:hypothetical protein BDU57DRAFT_362320 [Ampelomyces quisqualis]|uniref:Uncharacterized protein n=1 Tax=Ampelomyces quisqualis TaxID=50730 RepID=A0A6A5QAH7_AMPQU|nr:hypothetical protein BDU57DRAFT_362320 [Ampelomyces quisqualis]
MRSDWACPMPLRETLVVLCNWLHGLFNFRAVTNHSSYQQLCVTSLRSTPHRPQLCARAVQHSFPYFQLQSERKSNSGFEEPHDTDTCDSFHRRTILGESTLSRHRLPLCHRAEGIRGKFGALAQRGVRSAVQTRPELKIGFLAVVYNGCDWSIGC